MKQEGAVGVVALLAGEAGRRSTWLLSVAAYTHAMLNHQATTHYHGGVQ